jgi:hypothetical protein
VINGELISLDFDELNNQVVFGTPAHKFLKDPYRRPGKRLRRKVTAQLVSLHRR